MSNTFGEPLLTDTLSKEWLLMKKHSIILNTAEIQKERT